MYELTGNDVHNIHICLTIYLSSVPAAQSRYHRRTVQTTVEGTPFFVNHEHGAPGLMICGTLEKHLLTYIIVETLFIAKTYSFNSNCQTAIKLNKGEINSRTLIHTVSQKKTEYVSNRILKISWKSKL